jgi:hypothetical protein
MSNTVSSYIDYFRQLAITHKDLKHKIESENGDAKVGEKAFIRWSIEEALSALKTKIGKRCLLLELYETILESQIVYDIKGNTKGAFTIVQKATPNKYSEEIAAFEDTERIKNELLNKIWNDHYGENKTRCQTPFEYFDFNGLNVIAVSSLFDGTYFGWRVEFSFSFSQNYLITQPIPNGIFI